MGTNKKVLIAVIVLGGATAFFFGLKKKPVSAAAATEPYTDKTVTDSETLATTNTPDVIAAIPSTSFIGVTANGTTINTNTTPVSTTYSKYPVGDQLVFADSPVSGRVYTITAIQSGYYVMSYSGGGPLTEQVSIVDNESAWSEYVPGVSSTTAPVVVTTETAAAAQSNASSESTVVVNGVSVPTTTPGAAVTTEYTPAQIAALATENTALAANPGSVPVNTDSEGNQYVVNNEGEAVYLGVPTFTDNLAAAGLVEVNGVWTYPS